MGRYKTYKKAGIDIKQNKMWGKLARELSGGVGLNAIRLLLGGVLACGGRE